MRYLKTIINKRQHFISLAENIFGLERLTDTSFVYFLASELNTNYSNLKRSISRWIHSGMEEVRGKSGLRVNLVRKSIIYGLLILYHLLITGMTDAVLKCQKLNT